MPHSNSRDVLVLVVGVLVGVALLAETATTVAPSCVPGPTVAVLSNRLTPLLLANSPYGAPYADLSTGSVPVDNGTRIVTLGGQYNGNTWAYYERMEWTVAVGRSNGSADPSCAGTFYPSAQNLWGSLIEEVFNGSVANFTNDSEVPTYVQGNATTGEVLFDDRFTTTTEVIDTCGQSTQYRNATSTHITIGIGFEYRGSWHVVDSVLMVPTHYFYIFPANVGSWAVDNLSAPGGPGGGWAFSYSPCP